MINTDIYGKELSNYFNSAISAYSQVVKPKITIDLLDSRHITNLVITNSDDHTVNTKGSIGYYFTNKQLMNGYGQESFTWGVCDAKQKDGTVIKADGKWHATPAILDDDYEFGWWSKSKSQANGVFASSPVLTMSFDERKVNKVRVTTSESLGQIKSFRIRVQDSSFIDLLDKTVILNDDEYYKDFYLKSTNASNSDYNASNIIVTVISTKNGTDCARIHEISPIYELDVTDNVIDYSVSRSRDVHESSLPIGGTQSPKITIKLDNNEKIWNIFDQLNGYGKYMTKDIKVNIATGWRIKKTDDVISTTTLKSAISSSDAYISVLDASIFPIGGVSNYFTATIDPDNENREIILFGQNTYTTWAGQPHASTSQFGTTRTNLLTNPSFETNITGWTSIGTATTTVTRNTNQSLFGSASLQGTATVSGNMRLANANTAVSPPAIPVTAGLSYTASAYSMAATTPRLFDVLIEFFNSAGGTISVPESADITNTTTGWTRQSVTATAPVDAVTCRMSVRMLSVLVGEIHYIDGALFEQSSSLQEYFDGSTLDENTLTIAERGYHDSDPISHSANAIVQFDPYEYVNMGTYYVDEWSSSTSDMTVTMQASDFSKFLSEKNLSNGFLVENKTAGDAVSNLLMRANFPKSKFKQIISYSKDAINYGAIVKYSFSEDSIDKTGAISSLEPGLRARFWGMRSDREYEYKDIKADVLEKTLSIEDRIAGITSFSTPDYTILTTDSPGSLSYALNYSNYSFTSILDSETYTKYFNGVIDGYYIPLLDGNQDLMLRVANGGVRMYLDDVLIINSYKEAFSSTDFSAYTTRSNNFLNLTAGVPYRIRIEFWHGYGDANFSIGLYKSNTSFTYGLVSGTEVRSIVARDGLGSRNSNESLVSYDKANVSLSHHQNDAFLSSDVQLAYSNSITTEENNRGILLTNNGYVRIPNHSSIAISENDFTIELVTKFHDGYFIGGDGEYLSTWANSTPASGYEFYLNGTTSHGIKIKTSAGIYSATGTTEFDINTFYHIVATYSASTKKLKYYVNSILEGEVLLSGTIVTQTRDITIGGRGASFQIGVGESGIVTGRDFIIDELAIYKKCLTADNILDRYISAQVDTPMTFPFLYSGVGHIREAIDAITLGDLGRFYIDEEGYARYESYNRFFEPSIDQHANVQYTINDSSEIISSDFSNQLQTNKVIVKISSVASVESGTQPLWSAPSPTTLAVVSLTADIADIDTFIPVSTTTNPVFSNTGYIAMSKIVLGEVKTEIMKYLSKTDTSFLEVERGKFDTIPLAFDAETKVREVRYFEINYDKSPAIAINQPFIIGINDEDPDLINILKFESNAYTAKLIIAASDSNDDGAIVYAQGKDPISEKEYFAAVSGIPIMVMSNNEQITEQVGSLQENIRKYGLKEITIDSPYITSTEHASKIAQFIIDKMSEPVPIINVNIMSIPTFQLGDRIKIGSLDAFDIIDGEYWIISQEFSYGESISHSLILRKVV